MADRDFGKDCIVNPHDLYGEWLRQPSLAQKYAEEVARAEDAVGVLEDKFNLLKADLDLDIRFDPANYGLSADKAPTEAGIKAAMLKTDKYQAMQTQTREAELNCKLIKTAYNSITHQRKSALEYLVDMDLSGLYNHLKPRTEAVKAAVSKQDTSSPEHLGVLSKNTRLKNRNLK